MDDSLRIGRIARLLLGGMIAGVVIGISLASCTGRSVPTELPAATDETTVEPAATEEPMSGTDVAFEEGLRLYEPITIIDRAGEALGDGEVRLYAPDRVDLGRTIEVRLEIEVWDADPSIFNPPPSPTPMLGTPHPTPSPLPLSDIQFIEVRQFMGARLGGLDVRSFEIVPVPPDGIREMQPNAINWWKWNVSAVDSGAVGDNQLEVVVYLPNILSDGTTFNEETNLIPFTLIVSEQPTVTPSPTVTPTLTPVPTLTPTPSVVERIIIGANSIEGVLATIVGIATLISLTYGGYRFLAERRKSQSKRLQDRKTTDEKR